MEKNKIIILLLILGNIPVDKIKLNNEADYLECEKDNEEDNIYNVIRCFVLKNHFKGKKWILLYNL